MFTDADMSDIIQSADKAILIFVQEHIRCPLLDPVMKAASFLGDGGLLWILLAIILLIFPKTRRGGFDLFLCMAAPWLLTEYVVKNLVGRPRPYLSLEELTLIVEPLQSFSFPSGHACAAFAAATALALAFRGQGGGWAFAPAGLIAVSRVYVGVHYPSDVLAGAAIGALGSWGVYILSRRFIKTRLLFRRE